MSPARTPACRRSPGRPDSVSVRTGRHSPSSRGDAELLDEQRSGRLERHPAGREVDAPGADLKARLAPICPSRELRTAQASADHSTRARHRVAPGQAKG
jgi:hypothetical protein